MKRIALLLTSLTLLGCSKSAPDQTPVRSEPKHSAVRVDPELLASGRIVVARAEERPIGGFILATGQIEAPPDGVAVLTSPVTGRVLALEVRRGDVVQKGQVLALLHAGEITRIQADLAQASARRVHAERVLGQEEQLDREAATSERALSDARSALAAATAEERSARSLLSTFGAAGGGRLLLKAPISGTVTDVDVVVGSPVHGMAPVIRIVDPTRLLARADVAESDADQAARGARATLTIAGRSGSCEATVESHAPSVDPRTRTVPFWVRPGAGCSDFHDGAFIDVSIEKRADSGQRRVSLPRDAVVSADDASLVFVARPTSGEYEPRSVRVAEYAGSVVLLEHGVKPGERVVTRGALLLKGELMRSRLE